MPIDTTKIPEEFKTSTETPTSKSFNSDYISQEEALKYAAARGADDSIRGIQQMYGKITNDEELLEKLNQP